MIKLYATVDVEHFSLLPASNTIIVTFNYNHQAESRVVWTVALVIYGTSELGILERCTADFEVTVD